MEDKKKKVTEETFELYERIRPSVEEYLDEWFIVGIRPGCGSRVLLGSRNGGWNKLKPAYDGIKKWKKENPVGDP